MKFHKTYFFIFSRNLVTCAHTCSVRDVQTERGQPPRQQGNSCTPVQLDQLGKPHILKHLNIYILTNPEIEYSEHIILDKIRVGSPT